MPRHSFFLRGALHRRLGSLDQALSDLSRAIVINPRLSAYYVTRSQVFSSKGDLERAIADLDAALAIAPNDKEAQQARNIALATKAELGRALTGKPMRASVWSDLRKTFPAATWARQTRKKPTSKGRRSTRASEFTR